MRQVELINFSSNNTVDRKDETDIILNEIESRNADAIFLYSETGVGKSALTNRILKISNGFIPVRIQTNPENVTNNVTEGFFLNRLFNYLVDYFDKYSKEYPGYSFLNYLKRDENSALKRKAWESILQNVTDITSLQNVGISASKHLVSKTFNLNEYNPNSKLVLSSKDSMILAHSYIKYVVKKIPLLINIDNIQNIDSYSLELLIDLVAASTRKSVFLLEYTTSKKNTRETLLELVKRFEGVDLEIKLLQLRGLQSDAAIEALKNMYKETNDKTKLFEEAKQYYIAHSNGSMQKLIDYSLQYSSDSPISNCYDPTLERINLLGNTEKFILALVVMHGGEIEAMLLEHFSEISISPIIMNYKKILENLIDGHFLNQNQDFTIRVAHASLIDSWNSNSKILDKYNLLAYNLCEKYYNNLLTKGIKPIPKENVDQAMLFLLKMYSIYEPEKLEKLIANVNQLVSERIRPESVWEYYMIFLEYIKGNEHRHLSSLYDMVIFCFNHGLYKNCLYIIQILEDISTNIDEEFLFVYKINCFEYLEADNAIQLCEERLIKLNNDEQKYNCYLLLMGRYRSINKMDKVLYYVNQVKNIPDYQKMNQYGTFLRLSEIYMQRQEALPYVKQSVEFFERANDKLMEAKSRLTYFFLLALTSNLDEAYNELNACKQIVSPLHYWEGILYLNEASLLLLQKKYGQEVDTLLKKAELSINGNFDLLLTLTMQLINQFESSHSPVNKTLIKRIERLLVNETDKHLICLVAYNFYIYYKQIKEQELAANYHKLAQMTQQHNRTVSFHLKNEINPHTPNLFKISWNIGFTFFWNIDVPKPYS